MQLKALRPLTALTSVPTPSSPRPSQAVMRPPYVAHRHTAAPQYPQDDDDSITPPPPPANRPPRVDGAGAPLPPPPKRHRHHRTPPRPNLGNPTGQILKILGGITALVGAWHAAPAVHHQLHKHRGPERPKREDIIIELPETGAVHPDMGRRVRD